MRKVVLDSFFDFSAQHEGFTPFMYCDTLNLVTTGIGNLIDAGSSNGFDISDHAMAPAMKLPWKFKAPGWTSKNPLAGDLASSSEIREAWIRTKLKEQESPGFNQGGGFRYAGLTPLTLDMNGLRELFDRTLVSFDGQLAKSYPGYTDWPADAQLATLSMAWAMGPAFNFPQFKAAVSKRDFDAAAPLSFFKGGGGTPDKPAGRNAENQIMFRNAAVVERIGADPDRLYFPGTGSSIKPGPFRGGIANVSGRPVGSTLVVGSAVAALGAFTFYRVGKSKGWL